MQKKRILIVSELFSPQNEIGALRATKMQKYLINLGYVVDVITKSFSHCDEVLSEGKIWRIDSQRLEGKDIVVTQKKNKKFQALRQAKRTLLAIAKGKHYCKKVFAYLNNNNIDILKYDIVITTFGPISSVFIGLTIKKIFPQVHWICDFRDPMVVSEVSVFLKPVMRFYQNKACKKADAITTVSNGYLKRICGKKYVNKSYMIPNGYDEDDIENYAGMFNDGKVHISYVGSLYEGKRKITPLFKAVSELIDEGKINKEEISFDYAGRDFEPFFRQAEQYVVGSMVTNHGALSRKQCLELQFSSDFLILSTWNKKGEEGVFPGKFLEYMLIHKPIISITDGNLANGEVTEVMKEGNFGITYEAKNDEEDYKKLKEFIECKYSEWKNNGKVYFNPNKDVLDRYNYKNLIAELEAVISNASKR